MKNLTKRPRNSTIYIYILIATFYLWMAAQIPYTHDDWDWGLPIGMEQLLHATVNSRYVGNFFEVIMTRSELLKTLIMGTGYFLIPFSLSCLAVKFGSAASSKKQFLLFLVCNCLLLTMNRTMWRQTYGWAAGYANFVISALFMFPWISEMLQSLDKDAPLKKEPVWKLFTLFALSIISQLFLENLALYHVFLAVAICIIHWLRHRKVPAKNLVMLLGSIIGLVIMFSSSLYDKLFSTGQAVGDYRQIPFLAGTTFADAIYQLCITCLHLGIRLYAENHALTLFVLCVLSIHLFHVKEISKRKKRILWSLNALLSVFVVCGFLYDSHALIHHTYMFFFDFAVSCAYFCLVSYEVFILFRDQPTTRLKLFALWLSAPIVIAPLTVTTEVGSRLFFTSNIFIILFALIVTGETSKNFKAPVKQPLIHTVALTCVALFAFHGYVYAQIGICKRERDSIIQDARSSSCTEICLPAFPFEEYLHSPTPKGDERMQYFKEFYGIDPDVEVTFK